MVENRRKAGCGWITLVLVQQRQPARGFQHALDHEHHIGPPGVILIEAQCHRVLQRPGQQAFAELGDLLAVLQHDGVLADQVDAADMAVQVDADAGPVEPRRHLLDMGGLAGAVIALDHDAAVESEAGQERQRRLAVEAIGRIPFRAHARRPSRRPGTFILVLIRTLPLPHRRWCQVSWRRREVRSIILLRRWGGGARKPPV